MSNEAWLENPDGLQVPIHGRCGLGRAADNQCVIPDQGASRRHALIHLQGAREFWLLDLGSRNGTYLNGRRLTRPSRIRNGDRIRIGAYELVFHHAYDPTTMSRDDSDTSQTVISVKTVPCWLLLTDVIGSTQMIRTEDPERVARMLGSWLSDCRDRIEAVGGTIDKFLGDGLFAYWGEEFVTPDNIVAILGDLRRMQKLAMPAFRIALHRGKVTVGGGASLGEEELVGAEVNRVFRMEKLASKLKIPRLASEAAVEGLAGQALEFEDAGSHVLDGFVREMKFFTW
jgi:adenylate cyclase